MRQPQTGLLRTNTTVRVMNNGAVMRLEGFIANGTLTPCSEAEKTSATSKNSISPSLLNNFSLNAIDMQRIQHGSRIVER